MRVFISGPMGVGKSTVARLVARRLGLPILDLDARIEGREGHDIARVFRERGESGFRALEREEFGRVLEELATGVVALGGGTVLDARSRRRLLGRGTLVTLMARPQTLISRIGGDRRRPLLDREGAGETLAWTLGDRAGAYAEAHAVLQTDGLSPEEVAASVVALAKDPPIPVPLGVRTYVVEVASGARSRVAARARAASDGDVAVIVTDRHVGPRWAGPVCTALGSQGFRPVQVVLPAGEEHKGTSSIERVWDAALDAGIDRQGVVIALGGGVVGDVAGFAAATLLRGVAYGQVPTSLLAMVDSSVGGKTAVDRRQGKNLVGAFHQPSFVLCDVDTLDTLPRTERAAGLAEVAKSAWLSGEEATEGIESDSRALCLGDPAATLRAIRMAVGLKAGLVATDERELGSRRLLNLGHTLGHALEAAVGLGRLPHGEAVSLGMVAAFRVARATGLENEHHERRMIRLLGGLGLPTEFEWGRYASGVARFIQSDKKRTRAHIRFILPQAPGETRIALLEPALVLEALSCDAGHTSTRPAP